MVSSEDTKHILIYVALGIALYYLFFRKSETFTNNGYPTASSQCAFLKEKNKEIKSMTESKCTKVDEVNSRNNINVRSECYNFAGQEITSELDLNSWCQLDDNDKAIIDAATQNIEHSEAPDNTLGYEPNSYASF